MLELQVTKIISKKDQLINLKALSQHHLIQEYNGQIANQFKQLEIKVIVDLVGQLAQQKQCLIEFALTQNKHHKFIFLMKISWLVYLMAVMEVIQVMLGIIISKVVFQLEVHINQQIVVNHIHFPLVVFHAK